MTKAHICRNCGIVNSYDIASEYIDFHERKYKVVKKLVYQRKYHLENVINDICCKYKLQIPVSDLTKIYISQGLGTTEFTNLIG